MTKTEWKSPYPPHRSPEWAQKYNAARRRDSEPTREERETRNRETFPNIGWDKA